MQCSSCGKDIYSCRDVDSKTYCHDCFKNSEICEFCGKRVNATQLINNKFACNSCFTKIDGAKKDARIIKLLTIKRSELTAGTANTKDDFESLGNEALNSALKLKNYETIGIHPDTSLNGITEKCKELMTIWHPDLHKHDQEKYNQAVKKVSELKKSYEEIVAEKNAPYLLMELKYGASLKEIYQAYDKLKEIYNPAYFTDNVNLQEKVKYKRSELTKAYEYLLMVIQQGNKTPAIQKPSPPTSQQPKPTLSAPQPPPTQFQNSHTLISPLKVTSNQANIREDSRGLFAIAKEVIGCQVQLHKLLRDSDLAFHNMTGINPKGFHKDIRSLLENTCKEQWKIHDMIEYPMRTEDMTLIKLGMVCEIAQNAKDEKAHDSISKALFKLSEISCFAIKPEIYQYVRSVTDSPMYLG